MAKGYNRRYQRQREVIKSSITDSSEIDKNITLGATESPQSVINYNNYLMAESTNTSNLVDEHDDGEASGAWAGFTDRLLQGKIPVNSRTAFIILTIIWFGFCSWIFIIDNQSGRLDTVEGLNWFFVKVSTYSIVFAVALVVIAISFIFRRKPSNSSI